jgi:hypothetical protein
MPPQKLREASRVMLDSVDAEPVAVAERDPVAINFDERTEHGVEGAALRLADAEVFQIEKVAAAKFVKRMERIFALFWIEVPDLPGTRIPVGILKLARPNTVLETLDRLPARARAGAKAVQRIRRLEAIRHLLPRLPADVVKPVVARVVVNHIEQHVDAARVSRIDEIAQVLPCAEAGIDFEEVLNAVAVIRLEVAALLPDWSDPEGCHATTKKLQSTGPSQTISPIAYQHIHFHGHYTFCGSRHPIRSRCDGGQPYAARGVNKGYLPLWIRSDQVRPVTGNCLREISGGVGLKFRGAPAVPQRVGLLASMTRLRPNRQQLLRHSETRRFQLRCN